MKKLHISESLVLPIDAATQTFAFIARKGAGKSYAAGKLVEEFLESGVQVCVLDTVGNWYGLRISADGKSKGFDIPVLGGLRGDIPLEEGAGELIADIVVDSGRSLIIDLSQFSLSARRRFATAFGQRLWQRKKGESHPSPIHLVIEESQLIIPEGKGGETATMVGIYEEIIRLGRNYGVGVSMISQRPQSVNKEVLNQTECLFVLQVNGSQERDALKKWIVHQGMDVGMLDELPSLPIGTAYVWSPQWLRILQKVVIGKKKTFDSTATPKVGEKRVIREFDPLDLAQLQEKMKEVIARKQENDPTALKRQVAELKRKLSAAEAVKPIEAKPDKSEALTLRTQNRQLKKELEAAMKFIVEISTRNFASDASTAEIRKAVQAAVDRALPQMEARIESRNAELTKLKQRAIQILETIKNITAGDVSVKLDVRHNEPFEVKAVPARNVRGSSPRLLSQDGDRPLSKCERAVLTAVAPYPQGRSASQAAILTGYSVNSGGFNNALSTLRTKGYISRGQPMQITEDGLQALGEFEPLPVGMDAVTHWLGRLSKCESLILKNLTESYTRAMTSAEVAEATGYSADSGGFNNSLSTLRTLELITRGQPMKASDEFFQ